MTTRQTEIARRHVEAVTQMLLGKRVLQARAMVIAGDMDFAKSQLGLGAQVLVRQH